MYQAYGHEYNGLPYMASHATTFYLRPYLKYIIRLSKRLRCADVFDRLSRRFTATAFFYNRKVESPEGGKNDAQSVVAVVAPGRLPVPVHPGASGAARLFRYGHIHGLSAEGETPRRR